MIGIKWLSPVVLWAVLAPLTAQGATPLDQSSSSQAASESFNCQQLAEPADADGDLTPIALFERSLWASHCYSFDARAVRISFDGVRTVALTHRIEEGVEIQAARFLDGLPVAIEKRAEIGAMGSQDGVLDFTAGGAPAWLARNVAANYRFASPRLERIAGRPAWQLDIVPRDSQRYGYRLWLDQQTALLLKRELVDVAGRTLETFQITDMQNLERYDEVLSLAARPDPGESPWRVGWLPSGFIAEPLPTSRPNETARVAHRLYSDGLTSISLFVEPLTPQHASLRQGLHRLGISLAAVRHVNDHGRPMQITVLGEAPAEVLSRIAAQVVLDGDDPAGDSETHRSD